MTVVPSGVCRPALLSRLTSTCCSRCSSPGTVTGSSGRSRIQRCPGRATRASLVASMATREMSTGSRSSGRPASSRASSSRSSTRTVIRVDSDRTRRSACVTGSGESPGRRSASSEYPRITASGVRSSWLASAANRRSRVSLAFRRSIRLKAAPSWPVSVRGSVSGTPAGNSTSPDSSGSSATWEAMAATRRSGRSDSPTHAVPSTPASSSTRPKTASSATARSCSVSLTSLSGRPVMHVAFPSWSKVAVRMYESPREPSVRM